MESNIKEGSFIKGKDEKDIFLYCWDKVMEPKAVVQIFHGMAEHAGRYKRFADYLNSNGFIVYADDHRGHGRTAGSTEELGYLGKYGFNAIVEDEHKITELINGRYKKLPIIILGHSFGSFIAQEYIIRYGNEINGVILSGSAARSGVDVVAGSVLAFIEKSIFGGKKKSRLINYLAFYGYNKRIQENVSKFGWLSSDLEEVRAYEKDKYCGSVFATSSFYNFFKGLKQLYKRDRLDRIPKDLHIYIFSGDGDPVGNYGKSVKELNQIYLDMGILDVNLKIYKGGRHELLNEVNREEVFEDILIWINKIIKS